MVLKSLLFAFLLLCKIEAQEFFNKDEESSAGAGTYFYPRNDFSQYEESGPITSEDGKVSKRKFWVRLSKDFVWVHLMFKNQCLSMFDVQFSKSTKYSQAPLGYMFDVRLFDAKNRVF